MLAREPLTVFLNQLGSSGSKTHGAVHDSGFCVKHGIR